LDQSGDTTFAFSDEVQRVILLKQSVRDECLEKLSGKKLKKQLRLFAGCLYLLIEDYLQEIEKVIIDQEYPGHEEEIKWILLNILKEHFPNREIRIEFRSLGKRSPAHLIALKTLRKEREANRVLTAKEILSTLLK
jgi:hypothetical protein